MKNIILVSILVAMVGCKSTKSEPCDASNISALAKSDGKAVSFSGCTFRSQGNDVVSFGEASGGGDSIDCTMKGGEAAVRTFRQSAMKLDMPKLRLDVHGTVVAKGGVAMKDCEITAHD